MKIKIKQVQDYFKNRLLQGEFEVESISEHVLNVVIDSKYNFGIWIGNYGIPNTRDLYVSLGSAINFMDLNLIQKDRIKLHSATKKIVADYRKNVLLKSKRKELERLQKELGEETKQS